MIECRKCGTPHFRNHYWCGKCHNAYNRAHRELAPKKYPDKCSHCGKDNDRKHHYCRECHNEYNRAKYQAKRDAAQKPK